MCYRTHRSSGYCGTGVQNSQKFRVRVRMSCRTYRSSGYRYVVRIPGYNISPCPESSECAAERVIFIRSTRHARARIMYDLVIPGMPGIIEFCIGIQMIQQM